MRNILTIDVEEWFHILDVESTPGIAQWDHLPSHIEGNFIRLLDILDETGARATCFFLRWTAEHYPHLLQEAKQRGHEIASHGTSHELIYTQKRDVFFADITGAKETIEQTAQTPVRAYRAPGFSATEHTPWFFDSLAEAGYSVDSSIFPAARAHGGMAHAEIKPHPVQTDHGTVQEYPISIATLLGKRYCFSGGGYFRLLPYFWIAAATRALNRQGRPVVCYLHPRDIDPHTPRLKMSPFRHFKSYVNLSRSASKLRRYLQAFPFTSIQEWERHPSI